MAGDVQEPFRLSSQRDSWHSGSISFRRYEVESVSWERRSSFSHNRYLEEVEKCAKPGSVTEKRAYFEAHFRKKALLHQASLESQGKKEGSVDENSSYETTTSQENISESQTHEGESPHVDEKGDICKFDDTPQGSYCDEDFVGLKYEVAFMNGANPESASDSVSNSLTADTVNQAQNVVKCVDSEEPYMTQYGNDARIEHDVQVESESNDKDLDILKEEHTSYSTAPTRSGLDIHQAPASKLKAEDKSRSSRMRSRAQGNVSVSCKPEMKKGTSKSIGWTRRQTPTRSTLQNQVPQSIGSSLQSSHGKSKKEIPQSLKAKSSFEKISEKELRQKRAATLQPRTADKTETRGNLFVARSNIRAKHIVSTGKEIKQCATNSSFRSSGGADTSKEEKKEAEIRKSRRNLNFKEPPMPFRFHEVVPRESSEQRFRVAPNIRQSSKAPGKSLVSGDKQAISLNESAASPSSLGRMKCDVDETSEARGPSNVRLYVEKTGQKKEVGHRK